MNQYAGGNQICQYPMADKSVLCEKADTFGECWFSNSSFKNPKSNISHNNNVLDFNIQIWHCSTLYKLKQKSVMNISFLQSGKFMFVHSSFYSQIIHIFLDYGNVAFY